MKPKNHREGPKLSVRTRKCKNCGVRFTLNPSRPKMAYCSNNCRKRAWDKKQAIILLRSILEEVMERLGKP